MSTTKAQKEAQKRYVQKHDRIEFLMPPGAKKIICNQAEKRGMSMTMYLRKTLKTVIRAELEEEKQKNVTAHKTMRVPNKKNNNQ